MKRAVLAHRLCVRAYQAQPETYVSAAPTQTRARTFVNFAIYKGKAALQLKVAHSYRMIHST